MEQPTNGDRIMEHLALVVCIIVNISLWILFFKLEKAK